MIQAETKVVAQGQGLVAVKNVTSPTEIWDGNDFNFAQVSTTEKQKTKVTFKGGNTFICSPDHKFKTLLKKEHVWKQAKDLHKRDVVLRTSTTPVFDFAPTYKNLSAFYLGTILAINLLFKHDHRTIKIPAHEFELRAAFKEILETLQTKTITYDEYTASKIYNFYELTENYELLDLDFLLNEKGFLEETLASKPFFHGFMTSFFNYAEAGKNEIRVQINAEAARQLQQMLYCFGIKSHVSDYSDPATLIIKGIDLYKFFRNVSFLNNSRFLKSLPTEKMESYRRMQYKPLTLQVANVILEDEYIDMYGFEGKEYTANGVITRDSGE